MAYWPSFLSHIIIPTLVLTLYPFQCFQLIFPHNGIFFMPLSIPFKALTRMGLNLELMIDVGLHSLVFSSGLHYFLFMLLHWHQCIFHIYALVIILSLTVLHIKVQPFKKTTVAWYSSIDPVFLFLICVMYMSVVGTNTESMLEHTYLSIMVTLGLLTAFVPIAYITFLIMHWIYSQRRWELVILKNVVNLNNSGTDVLIKFLILLLLW